MQCIGEEERELNFLAFSFSNYEVIKKNMQLMLYIINKIYLFTIDKHSLFIYLFIKK